MSEDKIPMSERLAALETMLSEKFPNGLRCLVCKGEGERAGFNGEVRTCYRCLGKKMFHAPKLVALYKLCISTRGKSKGKWKRSAPKVDKLGPVEGNRARYLWRIVRFHAGVDCTMPMMFEMDMNGDPWRDILDQVARSIVGGSVGTMRWQTAITGQGNMGGLEAALIGQELIDKIGANEPGR